MSDSTTTLTWIRNPDLRRWPRLFFAKSVTKIQCRLSSYSRKYVKTTETLSTSPVMEPTFLLNWLLLDEAQWSREIILLSAGISELRRNQMLRPQLHSSKTSRRWRAADLRSCRMTLANLSLPSSPAQSRAEGPLISQNSASGRNQKLHLPQKHSTSYLSQNEPKATLKSPVSLFGTRAALSVSLLRLAQ